MKLNDLGKNVEANVECVLAKAHASQDKLNAVVTFVDCEKQIEEVKKLDQNLPLYGVPVAVKDNISTKGIRTTASSRILDNYVPVFDAHVIAKLKAAGAVVAVKTSMDELGMGGTNLNAYTGKVNKDVYKRQN